MDEYENNLGANSSDKENDNQILIDDIMDETVVWNYEDKENKEQYDDNYTDSGRTFSTFEKMYPNDNRSYQSYGYSLEDGLGSKYTITPSSGRPAPAEVNLNNAPHKARYSFADDDDRTIEVSIGSPASTYSGLTDLGTTASLLQDGVQKEDPLSSSNNRVDKEEKIYTRKLIAPPGKLGIVIDTTKQGARVHLVREDSPLRNSIFPGDRIIGIDDIDTRGMTASGITKIMGKKMDRERMITISSSYDTGGLL